MSEELKKDDNEDLTQEETVKLAKLMLGSDYTAEVTIEDKYIFCIHSPTFQEDLQISIKSNNMLVEQIKDDPDLKWVANIISTLRIIVNEVKIITKENGIERITTKSKGPDCFWDFIKDRRDVDDLYNKIILPLYFEYFKFKEAIKTDLEELKNS